MFNQNIGFLAMSGDGRQPRHAPKEAAPPGLPQHQLLLVDGSGRSTERLMDCQASHMTASISCTLYACMHGMRCVVPYCTTVLYAAL
mmetsp:Transcript_15818/g.25916  ORF Transcript_15818/g.25916 Transcript_15818/m.25916 type:complete len:87 (+) Transcript_15818:32-292(+)